MSDYDRMADAYARHRAVHPGVLEEILRDGVPGAAARVLEVGCGTGNYAIAVAAAPGCACFGLDPSIRMLAHARGRSASVRWGAGRAERLPFRSGVFDFVYSVDVIHHVRGLRDAYAEARRVLRPGGKVCTVTDSVEIIRGRRPQSFYFPETVEVELRRYPPIATLRAAMEAAGFTEIAESVVEHSSTVTDLQAYRDRAFFPST